MSKRKDNYETSLWVKFKTWADGNIEPFMYLAQSSAQEPQRGTSDRTEPGMEPETGRESLGEEGRKTEAESGSETGEKSGKPDRAALSQAEERWLRGFRSTYQVMAVILCMGIISVLLWTVAYLPTFGNAGNPDNNEVSARYIERGVQETGAVNLVTGMILDYRAFDTFGESCVLFISSCCVLALLGINGNGSDAGMQKRLDDANDRLFEPKNDLILQKCAWVLAPFIVMFGIYIVLNGHLSPGGGFSGGAVLGSGLILYLNAFGFRNTERFFTEKTYRRITLAALCFYCLAKSYSFFMGANHLKSNIPLGKAGDILSAGLILPLNICVGLVVACTMYAFYTLFRKGGM